MGERSRWTAHQIGARSEVIHFSIYYKLGRPLLIHAGVRSQALMDDSKLVDDF